jgi:hypothetical protein
MMNNDLPCEDYCHDAINALLKKIEDQIELVTNYSLFEPNAIYIYYPIKFISKYGVDFSEDIFKSNKKLKKLEDKYSKKESDDN